MTSGLTVFCRLALTAPLLCGCGVWSSIAFAQSDATSAAEADVAEGADADSTDPEAESPAATDDEPKEPAIEDLPWEVRPYQVLVSIGFADCRVTDHAFAARLQKTLGESVTGGIGPYWRSKIEVNDWLFPQTADELERLSPESLADRFQSTDHDKVLLVVLEPDGPLLRLSGCEWDGNTQTRGPVVRRQVVDRRRVASVTFGLLLELFRPLARIDLAEGAFSELRVRGGELLSPESSLFPFEIGDLLTAHFRYLDRDRTLRRIQPVPWTYVKIDGVTRSRLTATIETAFASPLSGSRRRVELVALRVKPAHAETKLSLRPRTNPNMPLVGVRVRLYEQLPTEENPNPERIDRMTDRSGTVSVPSYPAAPLRRLIVHSGGAVLSNVPFVPGVDEAVSMELPDDSPRLQVEGNLAMIQGDLIDLVSRRVIMLSRAVSLAKQQKFEESDRLLAEVDAQPTIRNFRSRILAIRVPAVEQSRANRDRAQEKRILSMCRDLEDLAAKYLDVEAFREAKDEVDELKKLAGT